MKTAFIIFSTNAIKIHKFSSSLICHTLDSERAASSMLHDFHKAHHPSDECSHFGERLHDSPAHCSCLSPGLQAPPRRILCRRQTSCGHQRQPGAAGCGRPCPMQPSIVPPHAPSRPQDTACPPPATGQLWAWSPWVQDFCFLLWLPSSTSIASLLPLQTMHTN